MSFATNLNIVVTVGSSPFSPRSSNSWSSLPAMPFSGWNPNCAAAPIRGKKTVLCVGTSYCVDGDVSFPPQSAKKYVNILLCVQFFN